MKKLLLLITLFTLFVACKKETNKKDECGCNGIIQYTIPDAEPLYGSLSYKIQLDSLDDFYNNKFWFGYTVPNCINCVHAYILCNEDFLSDTLKSKLVSGEIIQVKFSGYVTETCQKTFAPADYTYNRLILTKIEEK
ncbi:MAG: hypothetical protein M0Q90_04250 [Bacteroidales bacterium]|nr:hypothetical protein [Bacteroidales bacterium]